MTYRSTAKKKKSRPDSPEAKRLSNLPASDRLAEESLLRDRKALGTPDKIVPDKGFDLPSHVFYVDCLALDIHLEKVLPVDSRRTAICEQIFGTLNTKLFHKPTGLPSDKPKNKNVRMQPARPHERF